MTTSADEIGVVGEIESAHFVVSQGAQAEPAEAAETSAAFVNSWRATLIPNAYRHLSARVSGRITSLSLREGEGIAEGDLLFGLDDERFRHERRRIEALVELAVAQHKEAQVELESIKDLFAGEAATLREQRRAETHVAITKAKLQEARTRIALARIDMDACSENAPFSGVVARVHFKLGEFVRKGEVLMEVMDPSEVLAVIRVKRSTLLAITRGQTAVFVTEAGHTHAGRIQTIGVQQDPAAKNVRVTVLLPNPSGSLWPGGSGEVKMVKPQ